MTKLPRLSLTFQNRAFLEIVSRSLYQCIIAHYSTDNKSLHKIIYRCETWGMG